MSSKSHLIEQINIISEWLFKLRKEYNEKNLIKKNIIKVA